MKWESLTCRAQLPHRKNRVRRTVRKDKTILLHNGEVKCTEHPGLPRKLVVYHYLRGFETGWELISQSDDVTDHDERP